VERGGRKISPIPSLDGEKNGLSTNRERKRIPPRCGGLKKVDLSNN
jgi:hypothetical protein